MRLSSRPRPRCGGGSRSSDCDSGAANSRDLKSSVLLHRDARRGVRGVGRSARCRCPHAGRRRQPSGPRGESGGRRASRRPPTRALPPGRSLHAAIHGNLSQAVQGSLERLQEQIARLAIPARLDPGGGICQHRAAAVPDPNRHQAAGGALRRSTASRSRSNCSESIASNRASAATRRLRRPPARPPLPQRRGGAEASHRPRGCRWRHEPAPAPPSGSGSAVTAIRGCLEGIAISVLHRALSLRQTRDRGGRGPGGTDTTDPVQQHYAGSGRAVSAPVIRPHPDRDSLK